MDRKEYLKNYWARNREKIGYSTHYYLRNREKILAKQKEQRLLKRQKNGGSFKCKVCGAEVFYSDPKVHPGRKNTCLNPECKKEWVRRKSYEYYIKNKDTEKYRATHRKWWYRYKAKRDKKN